MNKAELLQAIADRTDMPTRDVRLVVDAIFHPSTGVVAKALKKGDKVTLTGFGTFGRRDRKARTARNPQTGESLKVKARKVPGFKAGAGLKAYVK